MDHLAGNALEEVLSSYSDLVVPTDALNLSPKNSPLHILVFILERGLIVPLFTAFVTEQTPCPLRPPSQIFFEDLFFLNKTKKRCPT